MPLEEDIVAWSATRPAWQRRILKRIATGDLPTGADYESLVDGLVAGESFEDVTFGLEELPQAAPGDPPVSLLSITEVEHVNALDSSEPLTVEPTGITLIYGNNGSGKSGYARVLRRISRARKQEEILTDVFRDTSVAKPKATLRVRVGDQEKTVAWPDEVAPELQRMLFYDEVCGAEYISNESPWSLMSTSPDCVVDGLLRLLAGQAARGERDWARAVNGRH
ncbi:MAG: ATP-binding protein [Planctomycetota bacterium]